MRVEVYRRRRNNFQLRSTFDVAQRTHTHIGVSYAGDEYPPVFVKIHFVPTLFTAAPPHQQSCTTPPSTIAHPPPPPPPPPTIAHPPVNNRAPPNWLKWLERTRNSNCRTWDLTWDLSVLTLDLTRDLPVLTRDLTRDLRAKTWDLLMTCKTMTWSHLCYLAINLILILINRPRHPKLQ